MKEIVLGIIGLGIMTFISVLAYNHFGIVETESAIKSKSMSISHQITDISGAVMMYKAKGNSPDPSFNLQTLVDKKLLKEVPVGWSPAEKSINYIIGNSEDDSRVCYKLNKDAGFTFSATEADVVPFVDEPSKGIPLCTKTDMSNRVPCCKSI